MQATKPDIYKQRDYLGYVMVTRLGYEAQETIGVLQNKFVNTFGKAIDPYPPDYLHITLMDWLAPLVDYSDDKQRLYKQIFNKYDVAFQESIEDQKPIKVKFGSVNVSPEAIYLIGRDQGQYDQIRQNFLKKVTLLPNTKMPAQIIHTTIARFAGEEPLKPIEDFAHTQSIEFTEIIHSFDLCTTTPKGFELLKTYHLG